jgi:hypothetical protein
MQATAAVVQGSLVQHAQREHQKVDVYQELKSWADEVLSTRADAIKNGEHLVRKSPVDCLFDWNAWLAGAWQMLHVLTLSVIVLPMIISSVQKASPMPSAVQQTLTPFCQKKRSSCIQVRCTWLEHWQRVLETQPLLYLTITAWEKTVY